MNYRYVHFIFQALQANSYHKGNAHGMFNFVLIAGFVVWLNLKNLL